MCTPLAVLLLGFVLPLKRVFARLCPLPTYPQGVKDSGIGSQGITNSIQLMTMARADSGFAHPGNIRR